MLKWGLITFGAGIMLIIFDIIHARRKKEGFTVTDRQRVVGMFWVTLFLTGLVVGLIYVS